MPSYACVVLTTRWALPRDLDRIIELTTSAFSTSDERARVSGFLRQAYHGCPFLRLDTCYVAETIEGRIVAKWQVLDLKLRIGRSTFRAAGTHALATDATFRGDSCMLRLLRNGRQRVIDEGFDLAIGFTQHASIFRLMSGVTISAEYDFALDLSDCPESIRDAADDDGIVRADESSSQRLVELYNQANTNFPMSLMRTREALPWLVRRPSEVWLHRDGYIGVRLRGTELEIRECAAQSPEAYLILLRFAVRLARQASATRIVGHLPPDHPLVAIALPWGAELNETHALNQGSMGAILHLQRFMDGLRPELEHRLQRHFGRPKPVHLAIQCDGSRAHVDLHASGDAAEQVHLSVSLARLLQLALGYNPPHETEEIDPVDQSELLSALFPRMHPFISHTDRF